MSYEIHDPVAEHDERDDKADAAILGEEPGSESGDHGPDNRHKKTVRPGNVVQLDLLARAFDAGEDESKAQQIQYFCGEQQDGKRHSRYCALGCQTYAEMTNGGHERSFAHPSYRRPRRWMVAPDTLPASAEFGVQI